MEHLDDQFLDEVVSQEPVQDCLSNLEEVLKNIFLQVSGRAIEGYNPYLLEIHTENRLNYSDVYMFSGPHGVGKSTVLQQFVINPDCVVVLNHSTRTLRPSEEDGDHIISVSEEDFLRMRDTGGLITYTFRNDRGWSGLSTAAMDSALQTDRKIFLDRSPLSVQTVIHWLTDHNLEVRLVVLLPPNLQELTRRLLKREMRGEREVSLAVDIIEKNLNPQRVNDLLLLTQCDPDQLVFLVNDEVIRVRDRIVACL